MSSPTPQGSPVPFTVAVPDEAVDDLRDRIRRTRWPRASVDTGWGYGTDLGYLRELLATWADGYDWRRHERAMNRHPHFRVAVDGQTIHYLRQEGTGVPLLLLGGWPQTFWDFADVVPRLPGFDLVVPDLPGHGFSTPLARTGIGFVQVAELFHALMTRVLGHSRFGIYGTDWGAFIGEQIAHAHPESVVGLHTTMPVPLDWSPTNRTRPPWGPDETARARAAAEQVAEGSGYLIMQASRPQTLAYLSDSPAAMAAWVVDMVHRWCDHDGDLESAYPRDALLTLLSIFWFTDTLGSSVRLYRESMAVPWTPARPGGRVVGVPVGVAAYPKETGAYPRAWVEEYFDVHRYTVMARGGHFPAVESPHTLAAEIAAFFGGPTGVAVASASVDAAGRPA